MKKYYLLLALTSLLFACDPTPVDPDTPVNPVQPDPVGTTYPRVQLIEHFTGEACGYCPGGMDMIYAEYSKNPDGFVWISNHTYGKDEYTISESNTIGNKLSVSSAPAISLNRTRKDGSRNYHPYYLPSYLPEEATTATSTISIEPTGYDPNTRELAITVVGKTADVALDSVRLTVAITESGMVGAQSDYENTWEGWTKFTHTHAARLYATQALGDIVKMSDRTFSAKYTVTLKENWVADNCEVVAWITQGNLHWPVLNAAKRPVVEGTQGGEDIRHGGIEEVPVPDTYPEQGAPNAESVLNACSARYVQQSNMTLMQLVVSNTDSVVATVNSTNMYPYCELLLLLEPDATTIPAGTYTLKNPNEAGIGDAVAGYRDEEYHEIAGCTYLWIYKSGANLYLGRQWMLVSGNIVVTENGLEITGTTKNGNPVHAIYTGAITPQKQSAPARAAEHILRQ